MVSQDRTLSLVVPQSALVWQWLILGVLAGGRCGWVMARNTLLQEQKEDERLRQQQSAGQGRSGISKPKQPSRIFHEDSKGGR
jgi:hypothetical protein